MTPPHERHRRLLSPPPKPRPTPTHLDKILMVSFAAVLFAGLAYLLLHSLIKCIHCLRRPRQQQQRPQQQAGSTKQDPESRAQLRAIPVQVYAASSSTDGVEAETCPVCLAEYETGEEVRVLPRCGHAFHRACIDPWLITRSSSCPICRDRVIQRSVEPTRACCSRSGDNNNNNEIGAGGGTVMEIINIPPTHPSSVL